MRKGKHLGFFAPGRGDGGRARFPGVEDSLAPPETRVEYLDGMELFAAPSKEPHAVAHQNLAYVLGAHRKPGYQTAVDMLTRTDEVSDFAPDASVFAEERDPKTGQRKLEELAFEVADRQSIGVPTKKARELTRRGVRRVFCILVKQKRLLEWSRETDGWATLPASSAIDDPILVRPIPVRALLDAATSDDAVAKALLARETPALLAALAEREARGEAHGAATALTAAILSILEARHVPVSASERRTIQGQRDAAVLREWVRRAANAESAAAVLRASAKPQIPRGK